MNHCLLEVEVKKTPTLRYTQDNQTPIAEMEVIFDGLRAEDEPGELKVVGWGNIAQDLQSRIQAGQRLVLEGRLRMNTITRQNGTKEKQAELTVSKLHEIVNNQNKGKINQASAEKQANKNQQINDEGEGWNASPLVPDTDEIPF